MAETTADDEGAFTHKLKFHPATGKERNASVAGVLRHFRYAHLPPHLQAVSKPLAGLAMYMADTLPEGPDLVVGLRDLLAAKDNFVRAAVPAE